MPLAPGQRPASAGNDTFRLGLSAGFAEASARGIALSRLRIPPGFCRLYYLRDEHYRVRAIPCHGVGIGKLLCDECEEKEHQE